MRRTSYFDLISALSVTFKRPSQCSRNTVPFPQTRSGGRQRSTRLVGAVTETLVMEP
jgi:hypothetical protein